MSNKQPPGSPGPLPDRESSVRCLMADSRYQTYQTCHSLAEVQAVPDGVGVFEGDYRGQIYLIVRASAVRCQENALHQLLADIDDREWADSEGARGSMNATHQEHGSQAGWAVGS